MSIKSFIGDDAHGIGHLQRRGLHHILTDTQCKVGAAIPGAAVNAVVAELYRGSARLRSLSQVSTGTLSQSEMIMYFLSISHSLFFTLPYLGLSDCIPVHLHEIGVAGVGDGQSQVGCVTRITVCTGRFAMSTTIITCRTSCIHNWCDPHLHSMPRARQVV